MVVCIRASNRITTSFVYVYYNAKYISMCSFKMGLLHWCVNSKYHEIELFSYYISLW